GDGSYGAAQFRPVRELKAHNISLVQGKSPAEIRVMLETPLDTMKILAEAMLQWNQLHVSLYGGPNVIDDYKNHSRYRMYYAGFICDLKDTWGEAYRDWNWAAAGRQSWVTLSETGYFPEPGTVVSDQYGLDFD